MPASSAPFSPLPSPVAVRRRLRPRWLQPQSSSTSYLIVVLGGAQALFLGGVLGLFAEQRFAIFLRDLVIVGVDFAEGQEAVAIAAIIDERRLKRRFDPGDLGEIDIALELLVLGGFEIKFLDPVSLDDRHPGFFRVARVDQHARCH